MKPIRYQVAKDDLLAIPSDALDQGYIYQDQAHEVVMLEDDYLSLQAQLKAIDAVQARSLTRALALALFYVTQEHVNGRNVLDGIRQSVRIQAEDAMIQFNKTEPHVLITNRAHHE